MEIIYINDNKLDEYTKGKTVLVDFFATWCGPCKMLSPVLENLKDEIQILKVDVDVNEELGRRYGVMSVPTLMIMKDNDVVALTNGFMPAPLLSNWIKENS